MLGIENELKFNRLFYFLLGIFVGLSIATFFIIPVNAVPVISGGLPSSLNTSINLSLISFNAINESYAYLPGRAGGQILHGGTGANEDLMLNATTSTTNTTSYIYLNSYLNGLMVFANDSITNIGYQAGRQNTGTYQTAAGYYAGYQNTGFYQTATGYVAGYQNTGNNQTATGYQTGYENTGTSQTATGYQAGYENTGTSQTAAGYGAGYQNTGFYQTATGYRAGYQNTGDYQTAAGYQAGRQNTGTYQTATGLRAGYLNTGDSQTATGYWAGRENTGQNQTAIGSQSGYKNIGNDNLFIGYNAGNNETGSNQFIVAQQSTTVMATPIIRANFSSGYFGIGTSLDSPNQTLDVNGGARIRNLGAGDVYADNNGNLYVSSDEKVKSDIRIYSDGYEKLKGIVPISYTLDTSKGLSSGNKRDVGFSAQNLLDAGLIEAVATKEDTVRQLREKTPARKECSVNIDGEKECETISATWEYIDVPTGTYTYTLSEKPILAVLVNALKEESAKVDSQEIVINQLIKRITDLEKKVGI